MIKTYLATEWYSSKEITSDFILSPRSLAIESICSIANFKRISDEIFMKGFRTHS